MTSSDFVPDRLTGIGLGSGLTRFFKFDDGIAFFDQPIQKEIREHNLVMRVYFELSEKDDEFQRIEDLFSSHGSTVSSFNLEDLRKGHIGKGDTDSYAEFLDSYRMSCSDFREMFSDSVFAVQRGFESKDGLVILVCDYSDYAILLVTKLDSDRVFGSLSETSVARIEGQILDGSIQEFEGEVVRKFLTKFKQFLR